MNPLFDLLRKRTSLTIALSSPGGLRRPIVRVNDADYLTYSLWQAHDETFPTLNSLLNAPPLIPELTVDHVTVHELIPGPQLIVPERIPTPVFDPRLRGDLFIRG